MRRVSSEFESHLGRLFGPNRWRAGPRARLPHARGSSQSVARHRRSPCTNCRARRVILSRYGKQANKSNNERWGPHVTSELRSTARSRCICLLLDHAHQSVSAGKLQTRWKLWGAHHHRPLVGRASNALLIPLARAFHTCIPAGFKPAQATRIASRFSAHCRVRNRLAEPRQPAFAFGHTARAAQG